MYRSVRSDPSLEWSSFCRSGRPPLCHCVTGGKRGQSSLQTNRLHLKGFAIGGHCLTSVLDFSGEFNERDVAGEDVDFADVIRMLVKLVGKHDFTTLLLLVQVVDTQVDVGFSSPVNISFS